MGTLKPLLLYSTHIIQKVEFALAITEEVDLLRTNLVVELVTLTFRLSKFEPAYSHNLQPANLSRLPPSPLSGCLHRRSPVASSVFSTEHSECFCGLGLWLAFILPDRSATTWYFCSLVVGGTTKKYSHYAGPCNISQFHHPTIRWRWLAHPLHGPGSL